MTLTAGAVAGLLAVNQAGFRPGLFFLALAGILLAHTANNLMNDLFDLEVGADTDSYPRALYAPHPVLSGMISRRGLQLAERLAASMGVPVGYEDPLTGEVSIVDPPEGEPDPPAPREEPEPVPWLTGLTVSAFVFVLVMFAVLTLAITLAATNPLLAIASNVVVTAGMLPSVWLVRRTPIWRWISLGVAVAIGVGWLALPFIVL